MIDELAKTAFETFYAGSDLGWKWEGQIEKTKKHWRYVIGAVLRRREELEPTSNEEKLHQILQWIEAYPLNIFPEPDFVAVRKTLEAAGLTLDAVSASNMRHVLTGIKRILDEDIALQEEKS